MPLKALDILVIAFASALTLLLAFNAYSGGNAAARLTIRGPGGSWVFPLEAEERLSVSGPLGETVVAVRGGRAAIVSSPCQGQTCVAAGELHRSGQWAACLPNRVFLLVEGEAEYDIDALSW